MWWPGEPTDDLTLVPPFAPPLGGHLTMQGYRRKGLLENMISLFRGIRFRQMNLHRVCGVQFLLDACADTLESAVLPRIDPFSEQFSPKSVQVLANNFVGGDFSLQDFDLLRNKSLRTLWVPAPLINPTWTYNHKPGTIAFLTYVVSTITSSAPLEIIVLYGDDDFRGVKPWYSDWPPLRELSRAERVEEASRHRERFEILLCRSVRTKNKSRHNGTFLHVF